jgi:hypothetical protein
MDASLAISLPCKLNSTLSQVKSGKDHNYRCFRNIKAFRFASVNLTILRKERFGLFIWQTCLRRLFNENVIERLALISLGRNAGLSLDDIGKMLTSKGVVVYRGLLLSKEDTLDLPMKQLTAMRNGLRYAEACKAPSHLSALYFTSFKDDRQSSF